MKPSVSFGLTIAVIVLLGCAVVAKYMGIFERDAPPAPVPPSETTILVAKRHLFKGRAILPTYVEVRKINAQEYPQYVNNRDKYLPPLVTAAAERIPKTDIEAGSPILRDDLQPLGVPQLDITPGMRSVTIVFPREQAMGGLIQMGQHVDILLTSKICDGVNCDQGVIRTAILARNVRVIAKRNNTWPVVRPSKEDEPISYTLEATPYRAAVIAHAKTKGDLSLTISDEQPFSSVPDVAPAADAGLGEDTIRSNALLRGDLIVGDADLEEVFQLKAPRLAPTAAKLQSIRHFLPGGGIRVEYYDEDGNPVSEEVAKARQQESARQNQAAPRIEGTRPVLGYVFFKPDAAVGRRGSNTLPGGVNVPGGG